MYSPWLRAWKRYVDAHPECLEEAPPVKRNSPSVRGNRILSPLFDITIPHAIHGFELSEEQATKMEEAWPAGTDTARDILLRFLTTKFRVGQLDVSPLNRGAQTVSKNETRLGRYDQDRDMADRDSSSRMSPYLSAGVISVRELIRETMRFEGVKKVNVSRESGPGVWVQEIGEFAQKFLEESYSLDARKAGGTSIRTLWRLGHMYRWDDLSRRSMQVSSGR